MKYIMLAVCVALVVAFLNKLPNYCFYASERQYLTREIQRASSPEERSYWKKELWILRLSLIPGISRSLARKILRG